MAEHVQRHLDTHEFDERADRFGHLEHLDDTVDEHVADAFDDHRLGSLTSSTEEDQADETGPGTAAMVAQLLSRPETLAGAIVLHEILRRPDFD